MSWVSIPVCTCLLTCMSLNACVSHSQILPTNPNGLDGTKWVLVEKKNGEKRELEAAQLVNDSLVGRVVNKGGRGARDAIALQDISALWIKSFDSKKTVGVTALGVLLIYIIGRIGYASMS